MKLLRFIVRGGKFSRQISNVPIPSFSLVGFSFSITMRISSSYSSLLLCVRISGSSFLFHFSLMVLSYTLRFHFNSLPLKLKYDLDHKCVRKYLEKVTVGAHHSSFAVQLEMNLEGSFVDNKFKA